MSDHKQPPRDHRRAPAAVARADVVFGWGRLEQLVSRDPELARLVGEAVGQR